MGAWAVPGATLPAGTVVQVVTGILEVQATTASSTYADTGLTATITPGSTSNKILVIVFLVGVFKDSSNTVGVCKLLRGSTDLKVFENGVGDTNTTARNAVGACGIAYMDSPASVSAQTYKVQFLSSANAATFGISRSNSVSSILLMEIKG